MSPAAAGQFGSDLEAGLLVDSGRYEGQDYAALYVISNAPMAHVSVFAPQGYGLELGRPVGAPVGTAVAITEDPSGGGFGDSAQATLAVADPAAYVSDPKAQACAPGSHAAVWKATLSAGGGRSLELPIFVDPAGTSAPAGAAYVLQACPIWPSTEVGIAHRTARTLLIFIEQGFTVPEAAGRYPWSALVTPAGAPPALGAEPSRTYELRATLPFPRVLTLRARRDPKTKTVVLSGRLTALGQPEANMQIALLTSGASSSRPTFARTNAAGEYQLRTRVTKTTEYIAFVAEDPGPCVAPSAAPAGCLTETVTPPTPATAAVLVREATDPKLVVRARDRALARRAGLRIGDFPEGWEALPLNLPIDLCPEFNPDLSALTATGEARSPLFGTETTAVASSTAVYVTVEQARTAFRKQAQLRVARCFANSAREDGGATIHSVGPVVPFPRVGNETRAFRAVYELETDEVTYLDLVSFRQGRVVVHMWVASDDIPLDPLTRSLAAKLASRARGG